MCRKKVLQYCFIDNPKLPLVLSVFVYGSLRDMLQKSFHLFNAKINWNANKQHVGETEEIISRTQDTLQWSISGPGFLYNEAL